MAYKAITLDVESSVAIGAASPTAGLRDKAVQIFGTFSGTLDVEASCDGTNFAVVPSGTVTAPGIVPIDFAAHSVRINTTAYASGTPEAVLSADNPKG